MLLSFLKKLLGGGAPPDPAQPQAMNALPQSAPLPAQLRHDTAPKARSVAAQNGPVSPIISPPAPKGPLIDLVIGLDIGTSFTKAVLGETDRDIQEAVPLNDGSDLDGYLRPTEIYLQNGSYQLKRSPGMTELRNLKIQVLHAHKRGREAPLNALTAYVALVLRMILDWHREKYARKHSGRGAAWSLNVGLPSHGEAMDGLSKTYRKVVMAAARLADHREAVTEALVSQALNDSHAPAPRWIADSNIDFYPEASAQLASLVRSAHCRQGPLMVIDVGAGTLDVSTLCVGTDAHEARISFHYCRVANLGVDFLHLAREGYLWDQTDDAQFHALLAKLPPPRNGAPRAARHETPPDFEIRCKEVLLSTVTKFRKALKVAHVDGVAYGPFRAGLPYVLSGGGCSDPYYKTLLQQKLTDWMFTLCREWEDNPAARRHHNQAMIQTTFPVPPRFNPQDLGRLHFDRFSVAHGLSLGTENLMTIRHSADPT